MRAGAELGLRIIPSTELNTESEWGDAHVLGYFIDPADAALEERLRWLRENRGHRVELMVAKLNDLGYAIALDRVLEIAQGGALGRPHVAQALLEKGYVRSYDEAFRTIIAKDAPAYVSRVGLTPLEAVELVRTHDGVPSLAHPGTVERLEELIPKLVAVGLAGIECFYAEHSPSWTAHCLALARAASQPGATPSRARAPAPPATGGRVASLASSRVAVGPGGSSSSGPSRRPSSAARRSRPAGRISFPRRAGSSSSGRRGEAG